MTKEISTDLPQLGWTCTEWAEAQRSSASSVAYSRLSNLIKTFSPSDPAWISIASPEIINSQWAELHKITNAKTLPLYGVPVAVKDNIDALGFDTTAASKEYAYTPKEDATVVKVIKRAGAIIVGKTNLDQFATGLVGVRSPYGKTTCVFSDKHVSGGSSAGSGSVVGRGLVPIAFGTDTAGSGRVPAYLNNVVGLKPTRGALSCTGVVPACRSLDCVSIFALNLSDAQLLFSIVAQYDETDAYSRKLPIVLNTNIGPSPKLAIPADPQWYGDKYNGKLYNETVEKFKQLGVQIVPSDFTILFELAACLYEGPWVAERYTAIKEFINSEKGLKMDPTVRTIILKAETFDAADVFKYEYLRQDILRQIEKQFAGFDGFLVPTCPLNPTLEEVEKEPIAVNSLQGTYTNFVNLADMSALAFPVTFRPDGLPFGVTLIGRKFDDYALLELASRFLDKYPRKQLGATKVPVDGGDHLLPGIPGLVVPPKIDLAVVGSHLSGMSLNWQLQKVNASIKSRTKTAAKYKLFDLPNTVPAKPGLKRCTKGETGGSAIDIEVWSISADLFGSFVAFVPPPLAIGSVELQDGTWVKSFVCEEAGYDGAKEITKFGGWRAYRKSIDPSYQPFASVLVANRGEIAVRIIRTLKKLGIKSIAIYSSTDKYAQHVLDADEAVNLGGTSAADTYLRIDKIISAAKSTGAQAIIPGYGFLSENAEFSDACAEAGIVFVGPSGDSIKLLGLKHSARAIAEKANVPMTPGTGLLDSLAEAETAAEKIGYPIMVKSTAGGGGIGLQKCDNHEELVKAFDSVRRMGQAYFNDSGVFLERFVKDARHVEVQVFGDGRGGGISLGERDCSLQRRNQKVIEETPAPNLPDKTRQAIRKSAEMLVKTMKYKNAGTVEYIYDSQRDEFYFLEVNARLQVEHPVTEEVTGLDLVDWMLNIAADTPPDFSQVIIPKGASMEARVYAENPVKDFVPSPGLLTDVVFPADTRVDTWVSKGVQVSSNFDPLLAKVIVYGKDRDDALQKLLKALNETSISGVVTNIDYLRSIAASEMFKTGAVATKLLDSYHYQADALEVITPGSYTTVQDFPGRQCLWRVGVPPSGPMDDYAFRSANRIVGNHSKAPAIECTLIGPTFLFHSDCIFALTGGTSPATLDDKPIDFWKPVKAKAGQTLAVGKLTSGCRSYLAVRGGIDVPEYLGSRSTFALGNMGGYNGRVLKFGDVLFLGKPEVASCTIPAPVAEPQAIDKSLIPTYSKTWEVGVLAGPHTCPDFFTEDSIKNLVGSEWKVHYNSNRFGVRLVGPKPTWARPDGGEAGLHPSNAHDYVYSLGAINFTGDEPVILTCDGPSLGGFVCPVTVAEAEMWKVGQAKPGDFIKFVLISFDEAIALKETQDQSIEKLSGSLPKLKPVPLENPVLYSRAESAENPKVIYRQSGDRYILVEYGENVFDIRLNYRVYVLSDLIKKNIAGVLELSPGVRSVLITYDGQKIGQKELVEKLAALEVTITSAQGWKVPSRTLKLPMAFEDKKTLAAVERYQETIRSTAPWLPNNVDFITKINHLDSRNSVKDLMYTAKFMVLGLGDVFLGAPCAVPLDPRQRLVGTKYNPSRTFTPNGTVGLGGMYMCIYTMESPGGYQLIGRTIPIWDKLCLGQQDRPWLLNVFDVVEFYPVSEAELDLMAGDVEHGQYKINITDGEFDYSEYSKWLSEHKKSIDEYNSTLMEGTEDMSRLIQIANEQQQSTTPTTVDDDFPETAFEVYGDFTGRFWKSLVKPGDIVKQGDPLIVVEAMKTEMVVNSPKPGKVLKIRFSNGDFVEAGDVVAVLDSAT